MTRLLDDAIATVALLPDERQDELARVLLHLAGHEQALHVLSSDENADLDISIAAERSDDFATDEEIAAIWAKHGR